MHLVPPPLPPWSSDLLDAVERAFDVTGATTPGWPAPHPDRDPLIEGYSRCLDPGKYRILSARAEAWTRALAAAGVATTIVDHGPDQVRHLEPVRPGAMTLQLATTTVGGAPVGLELRVATEELPPVELDHLPDCGCDACDDGSAPLLEALDDWVLTVARGGVVHATDGASHVTRTISGWRGSGDPDPAWLDAGPAPDGVRRWRGLPWR